jgi:hypothetical protein
MQLSFGSGALWGERTDVTGSGIGPRQFGVLQDIQIDFDWTDKELYGQLQFPVAIARGQGKISGKAKFAQIIGNGPICRLGIRSRHRPRGNPLHGNSGQRI